MAIVGIFSWWYGRGFHDQLHRIQTMFVSIYDYLSIDLLLKTLFAPFRQISAGSVRGPIGVQLRALADRLFSRMIGAVVRLFMIILGTVTCLVVGIVALFRIFIWLVTPVLPIIGVVLMMSGWLPWRG